jgi:adenosine deaminase CECR1
MVAQWWIISLVLVGSLAVDEKISNYTRLRNQLISRNNQLPHLKTMQYLKDSLGIQAKFDLLEMTDSEKQVSDWVQMSILKEQVVSNGNPIGKKFNGKHTLEELKSLPVFEFVDQMPKGGILHLHLTSSGSVDWFIDQGIFMKNCYVYWNESNPNLLGSIRFFANQSVVERGYYTADYLNNSVKNFRTAIRDVYTIKKRPKDYVAPEHSIGYEWDKFNRIFSLFGSFFSSLPGWINYIEDMLLTLIANNVQYIELRTGPLMPYFDENVQNLPNEKSLDIILSFLDKFEREHAPFKCKFIIGTSRSHTAEDLDWFLNYALQLRKSYPDRFLGFDLFGYESTKSTYDNIDVLISRKAELEQKYGTDLPLFLHDGESDWRSDNNLIDAALLGSKRIGHGFNLMFYPEAQNLLIQKNIAIEVCPLSNQILGYVHDLRIHPAIGYFLQGVPIALSSDDPFIFGYTGMTFDYLEALISWQLSLQDLKTLAVNSIVYSGQSLSEKQNHLDIWSQRWDKFIETWQTKINNSNSLVSDTLNSEIQ